MTVSGPHHCLHSTDSQPLTYRCCLALTGVAFNAHAGTTPPPTIDDFEIRSQAQLEETCYDKHSLCMMLLLDGKSSEVNKYKDITKKVALELHVSFLHRTGLA